VLGNQSGPLTAYNTGMGLFYFMLKKVKSIILFLNIEYENIGQYSTKDGEGRFTPEPEGWYYTGTVYLFKDSMDLSIDFGTPISKLAVDDNDDFSWSDIPSIETQPLNQSAINKMKYLVKNLNDEQLKLLNDEFKYWEHLDSLSVVTNKAIRKRMRFCETILYHFRDWYQNNHFEMPVDLEHPILTNEGKEDLIEVKNPILADEGKQDLIKENSGLKEIPPRALKDLVKMTIEKLIDDGIITMVLKETRKNKNISDLVIPLIEKKYIIPPAKKRTICDYCRKGEIRIKKHKNGKLFVV